MLALEVVEVTSVLVLAGSETDGFSIVDALALELVEVKSVLV